MINDISKWSNGGTIDAVAQEDNIFYTNQFENSNIIRS